MEGLPPSLDLPPHLSAHKYLVVCTLTVAAWDTLVLSPRDLRLWSTGEWPPTRILFHFLRAFMPVEFVIVAVAFFDPLFTQQMCQRFFLFEPLCTAILLAATSGVHVLRIHAIYDNNRTILWFMGPLFALQVLITVICCAFYYSVPLDVGQGCIAGPRHTWVGIYWLAPTLLYSASLALAVRLAWRSRARKPVSLWKLTLRNGLNLHFAVWAVNLVNLIFWFVVTPTGPNDPVRTATTSITAVLTTTMTLRISLMGTNVRTTDSRSTTRVLSSVVAATGTAPRYELNTEIEGKGEEDAGSSMAGSEGKAGGLSVDAERTE